MVNFIKLKYFTENILYMMLYFLKIEKFHRITKANEEDK